MNQGEPVRESRISNESKVASDSRLVFFSSKSNLQFLSEGISGKRKLLSHHIFIECKAGNLNTRNRARKESIILKKEPVLRKKGRIPKTLP